MNQRPDVQVRRPLPEPVLRMADRLVEQYDVPRDKAELAAERHFAQMESQPAKPRKRPPAPRKANLAAIAFRAYCKEHSVPLPVAEHHFAKAARGRMWRFDFAWPDVDGAGGVALECDGGVHSGGRHTRGVGFVEDQIKLNTATELGWTVFRVTPETLCTQRTLDLIRTALSERATP